MSSKKKIPLLVILTMLITGIMFTFNGGNSQVNARYLGLNVNDFGTWHDDSSFSAYNRIVGYIKYKFNVHWQEAVCVAQKESGINAYAVHVDSPQQSDWGVFQIGSVHGYSQADMFNFMKNTNVAYYIFDHDVNGVHDTWRAWAPITRERCGLS